MESNKYMLDIDDYTFSLSTHNLRELVTYCLRASLILQYELKRPVIARIKQAGFRGALFESLLRDQLQTREPGKYDPDFMWNNVAFELKTSATNRFVGSSSNLSGHKPDRQNYLLIKLSKDCDIEHIWFLDLCKEDWKQETKSLIKLKPEALNKPIWSKEDGYVS